MQRNRKQRSKCSYLYKFVMRLTSCYCFKYINRLVIDTNHVTCFLMYNNQYISQYGLFFQVIITFQYKIIIKFSVTLFMNKLDLIYEKEPPEVQRKLMNLLIQYNAMMQYNPSEDKFEVDLLLPFKTSQQKKEFIQNFKSRSTHKQKKQREQPKPQQLPSTNRTQGNIQSQRVPKPELFINPKQKQIHEQIHSIQRSDQSQISYQLTNQNYELSERRKTLSIRDISSIIRDKIKSAVQIIRFENNSKNTNYQAEQEAHHQENSKNSIKLNRVEMYNQHEHSGIQNQLNSQHSFHSQRNRRQNQKQIKIDQGEDYGYENHSAIRQRSFNDSSEIKNQILIEDLNELKNQDEHKNNNQISPNKTEQQFKQGDVNIPTLNGRSFKSYLQSSRQQLQKQPLNSDHRSSQKSKETENMKNLKQKLSDKYGSNRKVNNVNVRQKYSQFLKKNHRDFDRIYQTIRKQIKRHESQLVKSRKQDPILVLQQNISDAYSEEDRIFKEEIIKDYQKHIVVHNQNLSSEDLVRYFRYLLQNAKSLYLRHLRKGR